MNEQHLAETRAISTGNRCVDSVMPIPDTETAEELFHQGYFSPPAAREALKQRQGGELLPSIFPLRGHVSLLKQSTSLSRAGYQHRNMDLQDWRVLQRDVLAVARQADSRDGHRYKRTDIAIPDARPRGLLFVASARMGRRVTADRVHHYLGRGPVAMDFETPTGRFQLWRLPVLRVYWAARVDDFIGNFLVAFGAAMRQGDLLSEVRIDKGRLAAEALAVMKGFCVGASLGLLIVERINAVEADAVTAAAVWALLGQFTRSTGIPVISMATPGAAAALMRHADASGELTAAGTIIMNPPGADAEEWENLCTFGYQEILGGNGRAPSWLVKDLAVATGTRMALAHKCCRELARHCGVGDENWDTRPANFHEVVKLALYVEQPGLKAAARLTNGLQGFTVGSVKRYADWLMGKDAPEIVPGLMVQSSAPHPAPLLN